jgi:hypothetical protein
VLLKGGGCFKNTDQQKNYKIKNFRLFEVPGSVVDPDPDVFGPPGSGPVVICTDLDPDPSINKQVK